MHYERAKVGIQRNVVLNEIDPNKDYKNDVMKIIYVPISTTAI